MCSNTNCTVARFWHLLVAILMTLARIRVARNFDDDSHNLFNDPTYRFDDKLLVGRAMGPELVPGPTLICGGKPIKRQTTRKLRAFWGTLTTWWPVLAATVLPIPPQLLACDPDIGARTRAQVQTAHNHKVLAPSGCDFDDCHRDPRCTQL